MARVLNKDPDAYDRERQRFLGELRRFHDSKGTPFRKIPHVEGKEIDLYLLYWLVTAQGGWEKVNRNDEWEDLLLSFGIEEATANGSLALKQTYLRYLDPYEKVHFLGEEEDHNDDWVDEEDSRLRRQRAAKIQGTVPVTYNYQQHNIQVQDRANYGLSVNLYKRTDYDRLTLSLISPLPNEQDFAINVCTLLSNEGRHTLKLSKCPRLLDLLLGHAGVFNHCNLQDYLNGLYKDARQYDLVAFWEDVCRDFSVKELLLASTLRSSSSRSKASRKDAHSLDINGQERIQALMKRVDEEINKRDDSGLFASGRQNGTHESAGQRVLQIATIIRNLSFEEDNVSVLARNLTCLRFCLLCASSEWSNLNQMGFDILGNVATDININEFSADTCVNEVLLSTITACISSDDRFQVISSLDILNKLCLQESNEVVIESVLSDQRSRVYDQLVNYLSLHDIHLLISTLECLYSLSCLGESTCNSIVRTHGALEALVSLVTVEAQSYGPKACILMRVVETVPGASSAQNHQLQQAAQPQPPPPQLAQLRPAAPVVVSTNSTQPQIVRGQILQIQRPGGQLQLPQNPLPLVQAAAQQQQPRKILPQSTGGANVATKQLIVTTANGQGGQQLIIAGSNQQLTLNKNMVIATTSASSPQPQFQQLVRSQTPTQPPPPAAQPTAQQPQQPPVSSQQNPAPQQPQQQQVQLRVSNDPDNRQICLSWLKATYETVTGCSIEQQVMYKQYLASLHKLGRKDVISAQHYAVCVRTLFGGSVGPNRKQMPDGSVQYHYDGIQVRKVPLPFRVPPQQIQPTQSPQMIKTMPNSNQRPQPQLPSVPVTTSAVTTNNNVTTPPTSTAAPGSPILTHLLHRKNETSPPSIDPKPPSSPVVVQQENAKPVKKDEINGGAINEKTTILDGILSSPKKEAASEKSGLLASMLQEKKDQQVLVNGHEHEQYIKMNGNGKRPASTEPPSAIEAKKPLMENSSNGVNSASPIIAPEGSVSTTAGGQKVITTADGKQMIVKTAPNGTQVVVGTIDAVPATSESLKPLLNGQASTASTPVSSPTTLTTSNSQVNGISSTSSEPNSPKSPATTSTASPTSTSNSLTVTSVPKPSQTSPFLCEWQGCMKAFKTPKEVEKHAISTHCPLGSDDIPCLWNRCDAMKRKRFSLMTHLQDRHCHPQLMKLMAVRRAQMAASGKSDVPLPPAPPPHPGYAPNAALHAIKRHALEFVNPKAQAMGDEKEGPVTKSIRLTSSLILKNLVIYSNLGKKRLRSYESHLSTIALSNVESSRTVSQILYELSDQENQ